MNILYHIPSAANLVLETYWKRIHFQLLVKVLEVDLTSWHSSKIIEFIFEMGNLVLLLHTSLYVSYHYIACGLKITIVNLWNEWQLFVQY